MIKPNSNHYRIKNEFGFTLLEIVIAVGLMAVLFVMMATSMQDITVARNRVLEQAEISHTLEVAFARLFGDINMAFLVDSSFLNKNEPQEVEFVGGSQSLNFATMSGIHYIENKHDSEQHQVGYYLKDTEEMDKKILMRRSTDFVLPEIDKGGLSFELMSNVKSIQFEYYDSNKKTWKSDWDTRSVLYAGRLPQTVRVTLVSYSSSQNREEDSKNVESTVVWLFPIEMYAQKINF